MSVFDTQEANELSLCILPFDVTKFWSPILSFQAKGISVENYLRSQEELSVLNECNYDDGKRFSQ